MARRATRASLDDMSREERAGVRSAVFMSGLVGRQAVSERDCRAEQATGEASKARDEASDEEGKIDGPVDVGRLKRRSLAGSKGRAWHTGRLRGRIRPLSLVDLLVDFSPDWPLAGRAAAQAAPALVGALACSEHL